MRFLFVTRYFHPDASGGYEMNCRRHALELQRRGHDVRVLARPHPAAASADGVVVERRLVESPALPGEGQLQARLYQARVAWRNRAAARLTRRAVAGFEPDAVVFWGISMNIVSPILAVQAAAVPHAFDIGDYWLLDALRYYDCDDPVRRRYRAFLLGGRLAARHLRHLIVHSDFMRRAHREAGVPDEGIHVVPRALQEDFVAACDRIPFGAGPAGVARFLYVGRLVPDKGLHLVLAALTRLQDLPGPQLHLDVYGEGMAKYAGYEAELRRAGAALAGRCRAVFHGTVAPEMLPGIYRRHDALVFPAIWDEPSSNVILEAAGAGLPVAGTRSGSVGELLGVPEEALLPKNDVEALAAAIETVAADPAAARRRAAARQREVRRRHTEKGVFDATEALLRRLAGGSDGGAP
jgi:glycosyltransferase involved in cell wall biosynthesis